MLTQASGAEFGPTIRFGDRRSGDVAGGVPAFDVFALPAEYDELRASVRALADARIAPRAAEIDETAEFPWDVHEALAQSGFNAPHIPESYGGAGADALATAIVIEEVARACASSALIPAVNKLGTLPLLMVGSEDCATRYLPPVARGEAMFSYALTEPDSGSDAAAMTTRALRDGDEWVLNGTKRWISGAGESLYYTVFAVTDPNAGGQGISAFVVEKDDAGLTFGAPERKLGIKGSPTREMYFDGCRIPAGGSSATRAPGCASHCGPSTTPASRSRRRRSALRKARSTRRSTTPGSASNSALRSGNSRACSSCSPTWR